MRAIVAEHFRPFDESDRIGASVSAAQMALEHGRALRVLVADGLPTSALSLMRLQHEALVRALLLLYAASDLAIDMLSAPLSKRGGVCRPQPAHDGGHAQATGGSARRSPGPARPAGVQGKQRRHVEIVCARRHPCAAAASPGLSSAADRGRATQLQRHDDDDDKHDVGRTDRQAGAGSRCEPAASYLCR